MLAVGAGPFDGAGRVGLVSGGESGGPAGMGLQAVVEPAKRRQVAAAGRPTVGMVDHMIDIAAFGWVITAREPAGLMQADGFVDDGLAGFVGAVPVGARVLVAGAGRCWRDVGVSVRGAIAGPCPG